MMYVILIIGLYYDDECAKYIKNLKAHMMTIHERMCL
jgi:hypothetical protein